MEKPRLMLTRASHPKSRHNFRVLVPGAGLGRLAYDVANLGRISPFGASISVTDSFVRFLLSRK